MKPTSKTTGRPATFSRNDAIERAMNLFWRDGYLAVTARDLALAMDIQRSSFYNTFGTKEAVFLEALQAYSATASDTAFDHVVEGQPVIPEIVKTLKKLCRARSEDKEARGCLVCNSVAELVGVDKNLGPALDRAVQERIELMERLFRQAVQQGEWTPEAAIPDLARSFVAFMLGINLASKAIRSREHLESICRIYLAGIGIDAEKLTEL